MSDDTYSEIEQLPQMYWDGLENLAGFIAFKLRHKHKLGYLPDNNDSSYSWTNHVSEGGLMKTDFLGKCKQLDSIFEKINGNSLLIKKNYLKYHLECASNINVTEDAKLLFFKCKMYFKIRILNRNLKEKTNIRQKNCKN